MEIMDGDIILGDINGTAMGGARLISGKTRKALYLDGNIQCVIYKKPAVDMCFFHAGECSDGVTLAMWIVIFQNQPNDRMLLYDNGGSQRFVADYRIQYNSQKKLLNIILKDGIRRYDYRAKFPVYAIDHWVHFTFIWAAGSDIHVFLNGCDMDPCNKLGFASDRDLPNAVMATDVFIGYRRTVTRQAHVKIDDFKFWDSVLSSQDIWETYIADV